MAAVTVDTSEIKALVRMLQKAGDGVEADASDALDDVVRDVYAEAKSNAASFTKVSTGELAGAVDYDRTGHTRRVFAEVRQAFFLEYGSPTTGAPRPWLTGPAERGSAEMARRLAKSGAIW